MNRTNSARKYSVEQLVAAADKAARQVTCNRLLAAILVSRVLEEWLKRADRHDLLDELQATSCKRLLRPVRASSQGDKRKIDGERGPEPRTIARRARVSPVQLDQPLDHGKS